MKRTKFLQICQSTTILTVLVSTPLHLRIQEEEEEEEFEDTSESEWMLDGVCISDLCLNFKKANLELAKRTDPAQLLDIHLLALNDIYISQLKFILCSHQRYHLMPISSQKHWIAIVGV